MFYYARKYVFSALFLNLIVIFLAKSFSLATIVKVYDKKQRYISFQKSPEYLNLNLPPWVNNYERPLLDHDLNITLDLNFIDLLTSNKNLYEYNTLAQEAFNYSTFFSELTFSGNLLYVLFFFFSTVLNIYILWVCFCLYKALIFKKTCPLLNQSFCFLVFLFLIFQVIIFKHNLITRFPEEWALGVLCSFGVIFLDLFWGATLLDFKIVTLEVQAYCFFYGFHFEFLLFVASCCGGITCLLDQLGFIEVIGENEFWTKWD